MFKLAARNIFRNKSRSSLTLSAIAFGVAGLILAGGFVEDIFVQLREATIHSQFGHLQIAQQGYFEKGRRDPYKYMIKNPEDTATELAKLPQVSEVMLRLNFSGLLNNGQGDVPFFAQGVQPDKENRLGSFLTLLAGRDLNSEDEFGVIVGEGLAKAANIKPGDNVNLITTTTSGALNNIDFTVIGVFRSFSKEYDSGAVRIPLHAARQLLDTQAIHNIVVLLKDSDSTDEVANQIRATASRMHIEIKTWYELADFYQKTVALYRRQFSVLQAIILIMVVLSVTNTINMSIYERHGEFGTLMAIGSRRNDIFRLVVIENMITGVLGASLGVALGVLLGTVISSIGIPMPPPPNSNASYIAFIRIQPANLVLSFFIGFFATILAAILPARRSTRLKIVDALRQNI